MSSVSSAERCGATSAEGADIGAVVVRLVLPDPEAAELVEGPDATSERDAAIQSYLRARVADGSLVLP